METPHLGTDLLTGRALAYWRSGISRRRHVGILAWATGIIIAWVVGGPAAGLAAFALTLLLWQRSPSRDASGASSRRARSLWSSVSAEELAMACERRIGRPVDAAVPVQIAPDQMVCLLALSADALWILEDESHFTQRRLGRVVACWTTQGLVTHVEHIRGMDRFELSWPESRALVRADAPSGGLANRFAGSLLAAELAHLQ
jgi:hypothetical protein